MVVVACTQTCHSGTLARRDGMPASAAAGTRGIAGGGRWHGKGRCQRQPQQQAQRPCHLRAGAYMNDGDIQTTQVSIFI